MRIGKCSLCERERTVDHRRGNLCGSCRYFAKAVKPGDWVDDAACRTVDPELFWPETNDGRRAQEAQEVCMSCPVMDKCLDYAIDTNQNQGIWGGLTPSGRAAYAERLQEAV